LCSEARFTSTAGRLWEGREAAIAKVLQNAGGKLLAYYLPFGEDDFLPSHRRLPRTITPPSSVPLAEASAT
jgi:hypothetical protein